MIHEVRVTTRSREEMVDITRAVADAVRVSGKTDGIAVVHVPHTTAAVTINENADPDVPRDVLLALRHAVPRHPEFRHGEGNSDAHAKASLVGPSVTVLIDGGKLVLGTWQAIFFCEFDGPRSRTVQVKVLGS
jgi:secondary thiamine-phosphate synthase enzyme